MLMPNRLKRASFARLAVGLAVLAFPLLATSVAQASIAGAIPSTTTIHPDIRSATIDPTIGTQGVAGLLRQGPEHHARPAGLRARWLPCRPCATCGRCGDRSDQHQLRIGLFPDPAPAIARGTSTTTRPSPWLPGAVLANAGLVPNLFDSVTLTGSTSHSGTRGVTTAPNLVGVLPPSGTNQVTHSLTYVFDKNAVTTPATNIRFFFETAAGGVCQGLPIATLAGDGTTVITVAFNDAPCLGVVNAVKAGVFQIGGVGGVTAQYDAASTNADVLANIPTCGNPCSTQRPDLLSAVLNANQDQITYTFDHPVVLVNPAGFRAEFANGQVLDSTGAQCNGTTVCTAQFSGNLSRQSEYAVGSWSGIGTVVAADNITASGLSLPGYAPIGGNAGAFARGFTTGPDVFGITINKTTGQVLVNLDARVNFVAASGTPCLGGVQCIQLRDGTGNAIVSGYTPNFNSSAGPGPETVTLQYPPSVLTNATQVQFNGSAIGHSAFVTPFTGPAPSRWRQSERPADRRPGRLGGDPEGVPREAPRQALPQEAPQQALTGTSLARHAGRRPSGCRAAPAGSPRGPSC